MELLELVCLIFLIFLINRLHPRVPEPPAAEPPNSLLFAPHIRACSLTPPELGPQ